jgi:hypothetical protein
MIVFNLVNNYYIKINFKMIIVILEINFLGLTPQIMFLIKNFIIKVIIFYILKQKLSK